MRILRNTVDSYTVLKNDQQLANDKLKLKKTAKKAVLTLFGLIVLIAVAVDTLTFCPVIHGNLVVEDLCQAVRYLLRDICGNLLHV